ncbi:MAG: glycosyltransferase family 2 protein, partial [Gaiellaceae bacterium]|nr:glycosyltransferase family 2 protein [Gaiellaceae bacterium]
MRRLGTVLIVVGLGILAWVVTVSVWKDPFTTLYTAYEQRELESSLERRFETFVAPRPSPRRSPSRRQDDLSRAARRFRLATEDGDAIGRLRIPRLDLDVVVVDDCSTDETAAVAEEAGATVLRLPFNVGIGGAVQTGLRYARDEGYEVAVRLDGDGQHDAGELPRLLAPLERGEASMVVGSRFV